MQSKGYSQGIRIKTEKALESINHVEQLHQFYRGKLTSFREQIQPKHTKIIHENEWKRVQMVRDSSELFELLCQKGEAATKNKNISLKIVIKYFSGKAIYISLSSKAEIVKKEYCEYKITGEKIIKFKKPPLLNSRIYLTLHSVSDLNLFKLRYQFVDEDQNGIKEERMKSSSLKLLRIYEEVDRESSVILGNRREESVLSYRKALPSPSSLILDRVRLESAKHESLEKERIKLEMAREKRIKNESFKEKSKQLKIISKECTSILRDYQEQVGEDKEKNERNIRKAAVVVCLFKFGWLIQKRSEQRGQGMWKAIKMTKRMKQCSKKFMSMMKELRAIEPSLKRKQLLTIYHSTAILSKMLNKNDHNPARAMAVQCFKDTLIATSMNKLLNKCAVYRSKIRTIQKYWKIRNVNQMQMFKDNLEVNVKKFLEKHLYFNMVKEEFYQRNMLHNLGWQYLKETSLKLKAVFGAYNARLDEIQEIRSMNVEIKEFNSKCLKKYIKRYIEVPRKPDHPVTRYFRDMSILKSMLRSWFQIQYRRYVRRLKKDGKSVPKI